MTWMFTQMRLVVVVLCLAKAAALPANAYAALRDTRVSMCHAVVREMREELDATVTPLACVWHHIYAERSVALWGWHATLQSSTLTANPEEVAEILWLTADEVSTYADLLPRTIDFMAALADYKQNTG